MEIAILILYTLALLIIFIYSISQLQLLLNFHKANKKAPTTEKFDLNEKNQIPLVTIQLPLYNELYVVERLLNNISKIEYPIEKMEIQVLDDSTDESVAIIAKKVSAMKEAGFDIKHLHRITRTGFKAGALKEGLKTAKGDFIAIFDSDFLPKNNWLLQTVPYFKDPEIGVVQTRWVHINRNFSWLTKIQAFALDFHFILEQTGRNFARHFINFNGTAGIWRKECILDAGNWSGDTLTEDLDLSYRAQLRNWKFKYLMDVETPAELPVAISAAKSQQFRWNKGAAENFRKNYRELLKDKSASFSTKFHGFFHLLNSSMFLIVLLLAILSLPVLYIKNQNTQLGWYFNWMGGFLISTIIFFFCYFAAWRKIHGGGFKSLIKFIGMFLSFFTLVLGFSLHNSIAVIEGHLGKRSEFIRTPKFNINTINQNWKDNKYLSKRIGPQLFLEIGLWLYFGFALYSGFLLKDFSLAIFHLMLFIGFGFVVFKTVKP
ncbi:cellulose synthase family protein [Salegentibacter sp. F14]